MPNKSISMNKIRQVLRCYASGSGTKSISSMLNMSRNTVKKYLHLYQKSGLSLSEVLSLDDSSLYSLFQEKNQACDNQSPRYQELQSLLPDYAKRLKKKGVTRQQLFWEYQRTHPDGYARSRFGTYFQAYLALSHPMARLEHKAGDKMFIDYAGDKLSIIDHETGEILPVEVFVAILPCSQLTYVEAVMSQRKEDFIHACEAALLFYEGTPAAIVPDNLKAAVTKPSRYEAELNEDFAAFAEHYGCAVIPARVRKPRDKALVEGAVKLIYRSIYTKLEDREFYDLHSLNVAIRVALELHNNALLSGRTYSRREQFEELERDCMGPLNPIRFELKQRHTATVQKNGYVRLERHYYSVPYRYIGKKVNILYTGTTVDIYIKYEKIASYARNHKPYGYTYQEEHLASSQRVLTDWNPEKFLREAASIHGDVENYIRHVIEAKPHPEQAYKSCRGILSFASRVGNKRLINACRWASSSGLYNYPAIEKILKNRQDELPLEESIESAEQQMPTHENIRGKEYYN